jgi:hypothetical protein
MGDKSWAALVAAWDCDTVRWAITAKDEVVTFAARNLKPLRGYHIFMRA